MAEARMPIDPNLTVGQLIVHFNQAIPIFDKYGIPYYLEGRSTLAQACLAKGAPLEKVLKEMEAGGARTVPKPPPGGDWQGASMESVICFIVHSHHVNTRRLLDRIGVALDGIMKKEGNSKWGVVRDLFARVDVELRDHMLEEEKVIFPYLIYAERAMAQGSTALELIQRDKRFSESIRNILFEHRFMDRGFTEIEKLVYLFQAEDLRHGPGDLDAALKELKSDNEMHIRLENNNLLKRTALLGLME